MTQRQLYDQLTELLSLKQYMPLMGGDMTYKSKAERAKKVTKNKKVHALADQIITLAVPEHDRLTQSFGFFRR